MAKATVETKIKHLKKRIANLGVQYEAALQAESGRANRAETYVEHLAKRAELHKAEAAMASRDLTVERVGRKALMESLRRERAELVAALFLVDQRLQALNQTNRDTDPGLLLMPDQVDDPRFKRMINSDGSTARAGQGHTEGTAGINRY